MAVDYSTSTLTSRLQAVINAIDAGAGNGVMQLLDSGGNILSSFSLLKPSGTATNGVLTFNGLALIDPAAAHGGSASAARFEDSNGNIIIFGLTVGTDLFMSPTSTIAAGQTIALTAATITGN